MDRNAGQYQLHVTLRPVQPAPEQASDEQAEPEQKRAQTACSMSLRTMLYALIALAVLVGAWRILSPARKAPVASERFEWGRQSPPPVAPSKEVCIRWEDGQCTLAVMLNK